MSRETLEHLNTGANHYAGPILLGDVQRRLFFWRAESRRLADYILLSPALCKRAMGGGIFRKGGRWHHVYRHSRLDHEACDE